MGWYHSFMSERIRLAIIVCFHLLLLVVPLTWTSQTSELFEFPKMLLVYAFSSLILVLWLMRTVLDKKITFNPTFLFYPLVIFLASQIISTLFSLDPHTSLYGYYSRFHGGLLSTVSYLILYFAFTSNAKASDLKYILFTFLTAGTLSALYALPEHWGKSPSCYVITGQFNADCWVQDVTTRVYGTFGQPNWLAAYLITLLFIPLALIYGNLTNRSKSSNSVGHTTQGKKLQSSWPSKDLLFTGGYALMAILYFSVLLFTKSRSGILGVGTTASTLFLVSLLFIFKRHLTQIALPSVITLIVIGIPFLTFGRGIIPQADTLLFNRLTQPPTPPPVEEPSQAPSQGTQLEIGGTESGTIRSIVWRGAFEIFKKYPLFGSGVETFAYAYYPSRPVEHNLVSEWDFLYNKAHNEFLNFLATTGLFGFLSYLSIIVVYLFWSAKQVMSITHKIKPARLLTPLILIALASGFLALNISNFFGFSTVPVALLFFLFPALAAIFAQSGKQVEKAQNDPFQRTLNTLSNAQYLSIGTLTLALIFLLLRVHNLYAADKAYALGKAHVSAGDLQKGLPLLMTAIQKVPSESLYYDEISYSLSRAAAAIAASGQASQAAQIAQQAVAYSNKALDLNRVHLNYYKTRARLFVNLTSIDPQYAVNASQTLIQAIQLAPTDAKLWYNLGLLLEQIGDTPRALQMYQKTVELKPNYEAARMDLARLYQSSGSAELAKEQYDYILQNINPNNPQAASAAAL